MAPAVQSDYDRTRLWWLRLAAAGRSIDAAGPLIGPSVEGRYAESNPAVAAEPGREPKVAFLAFGVMKG